MADTDVLANTLLPSLIAGVDFSHSPADLTGAQFVIPDATDNPLYAALSTLTEADLTERKVGGEGMFDALMQSIKEHLSEEYRANRMSGTEYREAYVALTQTAMGSAVQYLLNKDTAYWQAATAQQQARAAEAAVVRARVAIELDKMALKALEVDKATKEVTYANAKQELATTEAQYDLLVLQGNQVGYQTDNVLPKEVLRLQSQIDVSTAEISRVTAQKDQILYQTASVLPSQKANVDADTDVKVYQLTSLYPSQVAKTSAETAGVEYTNSFILPAQKFNFEEQAEATRAKTLDTRSDASAVAGAIGKQKDLHSEQITSYKRDAEAKVAKLNLDLWMTQKSMDEGTDPPISMNTENFGTLFTNLKQNVGL